MPGNATDSPSPSADYAPGAMLGNRYRLERKVGTGGMAQVWEASDLVLDRRVAVKILHPHLATDNSVMRFRREAIAAARLAHPNVVSIFDTISEDSVEAIVMELVDGTTLRRHLDRHQRLSPDDALHIGTSVCDALAAAHASGLVHRDIKPANILLCRDGRVKIADFGIAKAAAGDGLTREGTLVGTAAYLSPEQVEGLEVDGRADLYALGLVLYEALTGSLPFSGDTDAAVALARLRVTPPNAHRVRSAIPRASAGVIARSLARDPEDRYQDAASMRRALLEAGTGELGAMDTPPVAEPGGDDPTPTNETSNFSTERRWLVPALVIALVGTALMVAAALLGGGGGEGNQPPTSDPDQVTVEAIDIIGAQDVDPDGDDREHPEERANATDGDPATSWSTERYGAADLGSNKSGVGIAWVVEPSSIDRLDVNSPTRGWSADVYVLDDQSELVDFDPEAAQLVASLGPVTEQTTQVDLRGTQGEAVLVWITNLGDADPAEDLPYSVQISEVSLFARRS
ncbi:MAG: protein kinase [Microthrixaceae bacterium]